MRMLDESFYRAFRCEKFSCAEYEDSRHDCNNSLCHVCEIGIYCSNCENAEECQHYKENIVVQRLREEESGTGNEPIAER